jgi:hypothetical protein
VSREKRWTRWGWFKVALLFWLQVGLPQSAGEWIVLQIESFPLLRRMHRYSGRQVRRFRKLRLKRGL